MPKKGDLSNPTNYRGITLLSVLYKFYTGVLNQRLIKFAEGTLQLEVDYPSPRQQLMAEQRAQQQQHQQQQMTPSPQPAQQPGHQQPERAMTSQELQQDQQMTQQQSQQQQLPVQ
jgi:hypothetical protein